MISFDLVGSVGHWAFGLWAFGHWGFGALGIGHSARLVSCDWFVYYDTGDPFFLVLDSRHLDSGLVLLRMHSSGPGARHLNSGLILLRMHISVAADLFLARTSLTMDWYC